MIVMMNTGGVVGTNCFLIADDETKQAVLFDAPDHTIAPLLDEAAQRGFDVIGLWLTHGHFDHIADHAEVTARFPNARVLIHPLDEPKLIDPRSRLFELPFKIPPRKADAYVEDGQELAIGNLKVRVIFTPGHSPGHVMYHIPSEEVLVGGDLIIGGAVGRTDFPDSDHAALERSIQKVMKLPMTTRLLPGHGGVSSLADELSENPYVQAAMSSQR